MRTSPNDCLLLGWSGGSSAAWTGGSRAATGPLHRGSGMDLAGLREYLDGDNARHIDWNVTARLDQLHVREFNEDRELTGVVGARPLGVHDRRRAAAAASTTCSANSP